MSTVSAAVPCRELSINRAGASIRAVADGPGRPDAVVVCSHGLYLDAQSWAPTAQLLRDLLPGSLVIRYDHRGHGGTPAGNSELTLPLLSGDMRAVLSRARRLAHGAPVVLAGHSLGAMTALSMLVERSGSTAPDALLLAGSSSGCLTGSGLLRTLPSLAARHPSAFAMAQRLLRTAASPVLGRPADHGDGPALAPLAGAQLLAALGRYSLPATLLASALRGLPVALVTGSADRITPLDHARAIAAASPSASLSVLEGLGHDLPSQAPTELAGLIASLLDRL